MCKPMNVPAYPAWRYAGSGFCSSRIICWVYLCSVQAVCSVEPGPVHKDNRSRHHKDNHRHNHMARNHTGHHTHKVHHSHKQDSHALDNRRNTRVVGSHTSRHRQTSPMAPIHQTKRWQSQP